MLELFQWMSRISITYIFYFSGWVAYSWLQDQELNQAKLLD